MCVIQIDDYLESGAEIKRGKAAMLSYISREATVLGRCPVCIAERILKFTRELNEPYARGKRLTCLEVIQNVRHTCGGENGKTD